MILLRSVRIGFSEDLRRSLIAASGPCTRAIVATCGSSIELTRELSANSMRTAQSFRIVCPENISEVPFSSSRPDRTHLACDEAITHCERESELDSVKTAYGV